VQDRAGAVALHATQPQVRFEGVRFAYDVRRQILHGLILKALLNRKSEPLWARIVHHAAQARDKAAVLEYAPIAARQAAALNAHREAASHYKTALQLADELAPKERAALFESRSYECFLSDQVEDALSSRRNAFEIWNELGDKRKKGDNLRFMSRLAWFLGRKTEAERYARTTVTIAATAIIRPTISAAITTAIVRSRGIIAVAIAVVRTVIAIAVVAIVTTAGANVGRLLHYVG